MSNIEEFSVELSRDHFLDPYTSYKCVIIDLAKYPNKSIDIKEIMEIIKDNNKLKMKRTNRISRTKAVELINNSKGRRFTVTFTKKDGTTRTINGSRKNQTPLGNITMRVPNEGYKTVNPNTIVGLNINRNTYIVG